MRVSLMHPEHDFDAAQPTPWNADTLAADLGLGWLLGAMAQGDEDVERVCRQALMSGTTEVATILYRQAAAKDALANASAVREIYALAVQTVADEKKHAYGLLWNHPDTILRRSVDVLALFAERLRTLRQLAERSVPGFHSAAFDRLFLMLQVELDDAYLARVGAHLDDLRLPRGLLMSAELGPGNVGLGYELRRPDGAGGGLLQRILGENPPSVAFTVAERDDNGIRALEGLRDRGLNAVANVLAQSNDHILGFFRALRDELAFYVGIVNLHERLQAKSEPMTFPVPRRPDERCLRFDGLYDAALSLQLDARAVGNDVTADACGLIVVTGANHGGKSTFLRSLGIAQLMMQSGMPVPASAFTASVAAGVFSHFKREEDAALTSGKLDEELGRMSAIVDHLRPGSLLLLNESFAATNEREGSEIARQLTTTLVDAGVRIVYVTHLYDYARSLFEEATDDRLFLRAGRDADGHRSYRLVEAPPLPTSYADDVYREVFGEDRDVARGPDAGRT